MCKILNHCLFCTPTIFITMLLFFQGLNHLNEYIAAQGPSQNTVEHFTQMIWEQKCTHIVMLTTLVENGTKLFAIQQFICRISCCVQQNCTINAFADGYGLYMCEFFLPKIHHSKKVKKFSCYVQPSLLHFVLKNSTEHTTD